MEDTLTRYCWLRKLYSKSSKEVLKAFMSIHEEIMAKGDDKVQAICADRGNKLVQLMIENRNNFYLFLQGKNSIMV